MLDFESLKCNACGFLERNHKGHEGFAMDTKYLMGYKFRMMNVRF